MKKVIIFILILSMFFALCACGSTEAETVEIEKEEPLPTEDPAIVAEKEMTEKFELLTFPTLTFSTEDYSGSAFDDTMLSKEKPTLFIDVGNVDAKELVSEFEKCWDGREDKLDVIIIVPEEFSESVTELKNAGYDLTFIKECEELTAFSGEYYCFAFMTDPDGNVVRLKECDENEQYYTKTKDMLVEYYSSDFPGRFVRGDQGLSLSVSDFDIEQQVLFVLKDWAALKECTDIFEAEKAEFEKYSSDYSYLEFESTDLDGNVVDTSMLSDYKLTLVNLWEPWCGPCKGEMPHIEKLYEKYKDQGFNVIGVHSDYSDSDGTPIESILSSLHITYPIIEWTKGFNKFETGYVPTTFFVDSNGNVLTHDLNDSDLSYVNDNHPEELFKHVYMGLSGYSYDQWEALIESLLEQVG